MGEFQKRAELYLKNPAAWHPKEILRWFEEAKQEFPIKIVNYKGETAFKYYGPKMSLKKLGETVEWFVKWFGSEKEEENK